MNVIFGVGLIAFLALLFAIVLLVRKDVTVLSQITKQASSGRWLLTVTAGFCLSVATITDAYIAIKCAVKDPTAEAKLPFPVSTIFTLSGVVFTFYFVKKETDTEGIGSTMPQVTPVVPATGIIPEEQPKPLEGSDKAV